MYTDIGIWKDYNTIRQCISLDHSIKSYLFTFIFSYYHLVISDGFEKDSDLFMLFFMRLHRVEVSNFNIASVGKECGPRNIFSLSSIVNSTIGLERGGQANLRVITEINHTSFYDLHK